MIEPCLFCRRECDLEVCWCGGEKRYHGLSTGHSYEYRWAASAGELLILWKRAGSLPRQTKMEGKTKVMGEPPVIINAGGNTEEPQQQPLNLEQAGRMAHAIRRRRFLREWTVATAERDAELRGIEAFLAVELNKHADELVGCWFGVHTEYEPLIEVVAALLRRAEDATQRRIAASRPAAKNPEEEEEQ